MITYNTMEGLSEAAPSQDENVLGYRDQAQFVEGIKQWVSYDSEIQQLNKQARSLREEKNNLTPRITQYMERNEMRDATIKISDGTLKYTVDTTKQGLTQKFLTEALCEYFEDDAARAQKCMEFIKSRRESKPTVSLKRTYSVVAPDDGAA